MTSLWVGVGVSLLSFYNLVPLQRTALKLNDAHMVESAASPADEGTAMPKARNLVAATNQGEKLVPEPIIVHGTRAASGRVLLIYTGGTLGMIKTDGAWQPQHESGSLGRLIQLMPEFHDDKMPDMDMIEYAPLLDSSNIGPKDCHHHKLLLQPSCYNHFTAAVPLLLRPIYYHRYSHSPATFIRNPEAPAPSSLDHRQAATLPPILSTI
eukprot:7332622-Prymnesium_polylepis.1